ncbi:MAG: hypothetical protein AB7S26_00765 [Sandaracinaceae bacterium]
MITRRAYPCIALLSVAFHAHAAAQSARLAPIGCDDVPFAREELARALELELSLGGVTLDDDGAIEIEVRAADCAPGVSAFDLTVGEGPHRRAARADVSAVPLGGVPRALALEIAELVRGLEEGTADAPDEPSEPEPDPAESEASTPSVPDVATAPTVPPPDAADEEASSPAPPVELGAALGLRNMPDSGAVLASVRALLELPLAHDIPIALRIDAAALLGAASEVPALLQVEGGLAVLVRAEAADAVNIRFGPRLWLGHAWLLDGGQATWTTTSSDVQIGASLLAGVDVHLADPVHLVIDAEVGSNINGLELMSASGSRSGLVGAYWAADVGIAFAL